MRGTTYLALFALVFMTPTAHATGRKPPVTHGEFFSENGRFVLIGPTGKGEFSVYETADRSKPLWSFTNVAGFGAYFVGNDGQLVADLTITHLFGGLRNPTQTCLRFRTPQGELKAYRTIDLCEDYSAIGNSSWPILPFSDPINWFTYAWTKDDLVYVWTIDNIQYTFSFSTGEIHHRQSVWLIRFRQFVILLCLLGSLAVIVRLLRRQTKQPAPSPDV